MCQGQASGGVSGRGLLYAYLYWFVVCALYFYTKEIYVYNQELNACG